MTEIEQLTKQKEELEANQGILQNWISLKRNLSSKFKNPSEAFKALKKENTEALVIEDFVDYSKGLDLSAVFKGITLNEENFTKAWESWEYQYKQNEHKIQMTDEKLELLTILEQKDNVKEGFKQYEAQKNKKILKLIQNCENLEALQEKLDTLVQGGQQSQKEKVDIVQNEQECFSVILSKKSEIKASDLQINKLSLKSNKELEESQVVPNKGKKSYLDGTTGQLQKSKISLTLSNSGTLLTSSKIAAQKAQNKQSYIFEPQVQISPTKGQQSLRSPSVQQPYKSPKDEKESERRSHKANRMKGDLQSYISELFQNEREQKVEPRIQRDYERPSYSSDQRGLTGFPNYRKYFKNQQPKQELSYEPASESTNMRKRVENIRYKLDDFQAQKLSQFNTRPKPRVEYTPERVVKPAQTKPKQNNSRRNSPQYTPGNTHRLNLDKLRQEKEQYSGEGKDNNKQLEDNKQSSGGFLSTDQLNSTLKGEAQVNP